MQRQAMLQKEEAARAELQAKQEAEKRQLLETQPDAFVRVLLASTKSLDRERYELGEFIAGVDALEVDRRASAEAMREHASFIQVLQAALDKEAAQFLKADAKRQDLEATNPEKAKEMADDMSTKVLMDQILLKMKNLREELAKASSMRDAVGATLAQMGAAAQEQAYATRGYLDEAAESGDVGAARPLELASADLELFVEHADRQKATLDATEDEGRALPRLKEFARAVERGVSGELAQVTSRLAQVEAGEVTVDEAQRTGMEKRIKALQKELHVLGDVVGRDDLGKVLHGLSQVLHAVVGRVTKRLSMRDKAKDKSIAAKEQQVAQMKQEAEAMREALFKENVALKGEKADLLAKVRRWTTAHTRHPLASPLSHPFVPPSPRSPSSSRRWRRRSRASPSSRPNRRRSNRPSRSCRARSPPAAPRPARRAPPPPPPPPPPHPAAAPSPPSLSTLRRRRSRRRPPR